MSTFIKSLTILITLTVLSTSAFAADTTSTKDSIIIVSVDEFLDYKNPIDNNYSKVEIYFEAGYINPVKATLIYDFQENGHTLLSSPDSGGDDKRINRMLNEGMKNIIIHRENRYQHKDGLLYARQDGKGRLGGNIRRINQNHVLNGNSLHVKKIVITY